MPAQPAPALRRHALPRRRATCACVLSAAVILAMPASSGAASVPWGTSQQIPIPATSELGAARLAFGGRGTALADWVVAPSTSGGSMRSGVLRRGLDGTFGHLSVLSWSIAAPPTVDDEGRGILIGAKTGTWSFHGLGWARTTAGGVGPWQRFTGADLPVPPSLSANGRGDAVVAWVERSGRGVRVRAALRHAGGAFGPPITVMTDPRTNPESDNARPTVTTAIGGDGRVGVVYAARPTGVKRADLRVYAWPGTVTHGFGARLVVGPQDGIVHPGAAITTNHRLIVAWGTQAGGIEAGTPWVVRTAGLAHGATRFGAPRVLDRGDVKQFSHSPVIVATGPGRLAMIAWGTAAAGAGLVRVAYSDDGKSFGPFQTIAGSGDLTGLEDRADGTAVASWAMFAPSPTPSPTPTPGPMRLPETQPYTIGAAVRNTGAAQLGAAEVVTTVDVPVGVTHYAPALGVAAYDPRTGGHPGTIRPAVANVVRGTAGVPVLEVRMR